MFDIGIIGAGPAGYTAAIRAAQYGMKVVLFEKSEIGGTCLNKGCIPTKALLHASKVYSEVKSAHKLGIQCDNVNYDYSKIFDKKNDIVQKLRKSLTQLITGYGIEIVNAEAVIQNDTTIISDKKEYNCKNIIIATGSIPNKFTIKGNYNKDFLLDSDDILSFSTIPENIVIVGSGAIGIEWARIFSELDKKVTLIEIAPNLIPLADIDVSARIERIFKRSRIQYYTNTHIEEINDNKLTLSTGAVLEADRVLLATGRISEPIKHNLTDKLDINKFIIVDSNFQTSIPNIFAIGDINGVSMLAHSAIHQAVELIEYIKTKQQAHFEKNIVPSVIYGSPEIAWIGETEQSLLNKDINFKKSIFPIAALGKAHSDNDIEGFVKILATDSEILGVHIVSSEASALIQQMAIAIQNKLKPSDIAKTIFAHPTYSEAIYETILGLDNMALHIPQAK